MRITDGKVPDRSLQRIMPMKRKSPVIEPKQNFTSWLIMYAVVMFPVLVPFFVWLVWFSR